MIQRILLSAFLLIFCINLPAQRICGTDEQVRKKNTNPVNKLRYDNMNSKVGRALVQQRAGRIQTNNTVYTIPVVFHVMHKGEPFGSGVNVSDENIYAAIKELNERFRNIPGDFADGNSTDMQYQFALAVRDPNGDCTNGINRVDMTSYQNYMDYGNGGAPAMSEVDLKTKSFWDANYYCNIWVVSYIDTYSGYSSLPNDHGQWYDGIVVRYQAIGASPGFAILTHEMGHYVGLEHTFNMGTDTECPPNDDCTIQGDGVCDTSPQLEGAPCELTPNLCVPGELLAATNYMSYSCLQEFTPGQRDRSRVAFDYYRTSLLEQSGNMALVPATLSTVDFTWSHNMCAAVGSDVQMFDRTTCIPNTFIGVSTDSTVTFSWTMTDNDDVVLTSTDRDPVFTIPKPGSYDVTLFVTSPFGTSSLTKQNLFTATGELPQAQSCRIQNAQSIDYISRTDDIGIREVLLNDLDHVSGTTIEDAASGVTNIFGYGDFSCSQLASLDPLTEYTVSVVVSDIQAEQVHVYIDFDNNGITDDDLVTFAHGIPPASGTYTLPAFTVPFNAVVNTRLRMRVVDANDTEYPPEACGDIEYYGQAQDYSVIVVSTNIPPIANDDVATTAEDHAILINVGANDTDDGTLLNGLDLDPSAPFFQSIVVTIEGMWTYSPGNKILFTPAANFFGIATIKYTIFDNDFAESLPANVIVTVLPVNDPPFFTKGPDQALMEDDSEQTVAVWATHMSAGPPNESSQTLTFDVTNNNNSLFSVQPSVDIDGDLSYLPAPDAFGFATVTVTLKDGGGTDTGGTDIFTQTFSITINPVNDPPVIVDYSTSTLQGVSVSGNFSGADRDQDGLITYNTEPVSGPSHGIIIIKINGDFTYTPEQTFNGPDVIVIEACDDGIPALCATKNLTVQVDAVTGLEPNLATIISVYPNPSVGEFWLEVPPLPHHYFIKVLDSFGRIVYSANVESRKYIDLTQCARGIYFLKVEGSDINYTTKIMFK